MKYLSIIRYALIVISVLVILIPFATQTGAQPNVDVMLRWTYVILGVAVVATIVLPLFNLAKNPKGAMRSLIGMAIVVVILLIAYAASDATPVVTPTTVYDNPLELKLSDTGLFTTYAALGITLVSIFVTEVYKFFK